MALASDLTESVAVGDEVRVEVRNDRVVEKEDENEEPRPRPSVAR